MAIRLKEYKINPFKGDAIIERYGNLSVNDLFKHFKNKPITRILDGKINNIPITFLQWNVYFLNYKKNNNVCKCSICGAEATHVSVVKILQRSKHTFRFFTIKNKQEMVFNIDHIIPVSKGGGNEIENLQVTCKDCNASKSNKIFTKRNNVAKSILNNNIVNEINKSKTNNVAQQCSIISKPTMFQNNVYKIKNVGPGIVWNSSLEYVTL